MLRTRPNSSAVCPFNGSWANLSTVPITRLGTRRKTSSSTVTTGRPSPHCVDSFREKGHNPSGSPHHTITRRRVLSHSASWPGSISRPHHGHASTWIGFDAPAPAYLLRIASRASLAWSNQFGVTFDPTHRPIRNGSSPHGLTS